MSDKITIKPTYSADTKKNLTDLMKMITDHMDAHQKVLKEDPFYQPYPDNYEALCKKFINRDKWTLLEAANLIYGCHPSRPNGLTDNTNTNYWVQQIVEYSINSANESLPIINPQDKEKKWQVRSKEYIEWTKIKGMNIPEILKEAYENKFSSIDIKKNKKPHGNTEANEGKRERVLSAAIAVMAEFPEQCRNSKGKYNGSKIAKIIDEKSLLFFKDEPPLEVATMARHINKALKLVD